MEPLEYIALANAALALIESLIPKIRELTLSGAVSVEEQQRLMDKANALVTAVQTGFTGPEWEQSGRK